jgi:hypothetical protein
VTNAADHDLLVAIERNTSEIADWLQVAYGAELKAKLESILTDDKKKRAYYHSVLNNSSRGVAELSGTSHAAIQAWWKEWSDAGIVAGPSEEARYTRKYDLVRLGISLPSVPKGKAKGAK